jgi:hypothetical protein
VFLTDLPVFVRKQPIEELAGLVIAEIRWPASGANQIMRGCGMVATGSVSAKLSEIQNSLVLLAEALSGNLYLRDQRA